MNKADTIAIVAQGQANQLELQARSIMQSQQDDGPVVRFPEVSRGFLELRTLHCGTLGVHCLLSR